MNESSPSDADLVTMTARPIGTALPAATTAGGLDRRVVLRAGALVPVGAGVVMLAACGQEEAEEAAADNSEADPEADATDESAAQSSTEELAAGFPASEVPVGEATYDEDSNTVYTQPAEGDFRAFDATCPHQGCAVSDFSEGRLVCPCHGSEFDPESGDVLGGPATSGLTVKEVTVSGDDLIVG
ncbi:MAG: Rieske (2Fe-2S) protein [Ornithinimicrobium sp.]